MDNVIDQLRSARTAAGTSQRELSNRTGLTQSNISLIENGSTEPGLNTVVQLARALDLELVLVPKKLVPAVSGIIRPNADGAGLTPQLGANALAELNRGARLVKKLTIAYGETPDLLRIATTLRDMRRLNLRPQEVRQITETLNTLRQYQASPQAAPAVREIAERLRRLRSSVVHQPVEQVRPAYGAEDEEDDDA